MPIFGFPPIESQGGAVASQYWRAPASAWTASNPILGLNEIGQETDTLMYKVGDGVTAWNSLAYNEMAGPQGEQGEQGEQGDAGYTPIKGVDYFDGEDGEDSTVPGPKGDKGDTGDPGTTTWAGITDKPTVFPPDTHGHIVGDTTGLQTALDGKSATGHGHSISDTTGLQTSLDGKAASSHAHAPTDVTGTAVITNDSRLSDARTPTAHDQAISTITGLQTALDGKSSTGHTHSGVYEPANANIQTHVTSGHAPSDAQKNSDITKGEIEAKLTGEISTHTHAGGGGLGYAINVQALTSSPTDGQTVYFGTLPKVPQTTAARSKVYIRKAGTITVAEVYCYSGTAGTGEAWSLYIRLNNTTDYLIATLSSAAAERVFSNSNLSISVVAGDYIEIKGVQPTWATNPATTIYGGYVYIE